MNFSKSFESTSTKSNTPSKEKPLSRREAYQIEFEKKNGKAPKTLVEKPEYEMGTQWYLNTFWRLTRSRSSGFSIGFIPLSEVINYGEKVGHIEDSLEDFIDIIQMMDDVYVSKASSKKSSKKS